MNSYFKHTKYVAKAMFTNPPLDAWEWRYLKDGAYALFLLLVRVIVVVLCPITIPIVGFISMKARA